MRTDKGIGIPNDLLFQVVQPLCLLSTAPIDIPKLYLQPIQQIMSLDVGRVLSAVNLTLSDASGGFGFLLDQDVEGRLGSLELR
jgi:hypothetical protein